MGSPAVRQASGEVVPRVVLDTNVVLSALVFVRGATARIRQAWQAGLLLPLASTATVQELMRVLAYPKFRLSADDQRELLADYLPFAEVVMVPEPPPRVPDCRDPHDLPFLHLAVAGKADLLISGDADLLALAVPGTRTKLRFRILSVQALLDSLPAPPDSFTP
jgi:putative PIN family toxin of toxin-antitoxin system